MLSGFGRKVSSLLFGSSGVEQATKGRGIAVGEGERGRFVLPSSPPPPSLSYFLSPSLSVLMPILFQLRFCTYQHRTAEVAGGRWKRSGTVHYPPLTNITCAVIPDGV